MSVASILLMVLFWATSCGVTYGLILIDGLLEMYNLFLEGEFVSLFDAF